MRRFSLIVFTACWLPFAWASPADAGHPGRTSIDLSVTADVGFGNEVYAVGAHPDFTLGGRLPRGIKLRWSPGNLWSAKVALPAGEEVSFRFIKGPGDNAGFCSAPAEDLAGESSATAPPLDQPPYRGKTIRYLSDWAEVFILYRNATAGSGWSEVAMAVAGTGRTPGERLYEASLPSDPGDEIECVFRNGANEFDNAPAPPENPPEGAAPARPAPYQGLAPPYNYRTRLDVIHVQDGNVFNYTPPATPAPPRIESRWVDSTSEGIPGRAVKIYLPRGYDQNTWKRYPVVYFHDGQNVFFPGGPFGTWDADRIATHEISQGRMREAILVAIDNGNAYGSDRRKEYVPPGDSVSGLAGAADRYAAFLADNVLPTLDHNYRTLNPPGQPANPRENIVAGSSLGGLVSAYIGRTRSERFGRAGIFSPAFWAAPNFLQGNFIPAPKLPLQVYMDIGSVENSASMSDSGVYWDDAHAIYNALLADGCAVNADLLFWPECGGLHNEPAWSRRLPVCFGFLLDPWDELQPLAAERHPPRLELLSLDPAAGRASIGFLAPRSLPLAIGHSPGLSGWSLWAEPAPALLPWERRAVEADFSPGTSHFWRIEPAAP